MQVEKITAILVHQPKEILDMSTEHSSEIEGSRVISAVLAQLDQPAKTPSPSIPDAVVEHVESGDASLAPQVGRRSNENAILRKQLGRRFFSARELCGMGQTEAALTLGYGNSTQLSLVERGERMPPLLLIARASETYGVSCDFLIGLTDEPDRDVRQATRNAVLSRIQNLLQRHAQAVSEALLDGLQDDLSTELRSVKVISKVTALCEGIERFRLMNSKRFDEMPGGANLVFVTKEARAAIEKVGALMENKDRLAEYAVQRARASLASTDSDSKELGDSSAPMLPSTFKQILN